MKPGQKIFTIGSCFARHFDRQLADLGFDIPVWKFIQEHRPNSRAALAHALNKYDPGAIYQDLKWAKDIIDRDGVMRPSDADPFLLETRGDNVFDVQGIDPHGGKQTRQEAYKLREDLLGLYKNAFDCDICIITLGLAEAWLDTETGKYARFNAGIKRALLSNRFEYHRLGYPE